MDRSTPTPFLIVGTVFLGVAGLYFTVRSEPAFEKKAAPVRLINGSLAAPVDAPLPTSNPVAPTTLGLPSTRDVPASRATPIQTAVAPYQRTEDHRLLVETSFAKELVDSTWAKSAKATLSDGLSKVVSDKDTVTSIECRSTICKAELSHDALTDFRDFSQRLLMRPDGQDRFRWPGEKMGGKLRVDKSGATISVIYFARQGTQLPRL